MFLFLLLILSCTNDNYIVHTVEKITYETIHDVNTYYYDDTSTPPPIDTSPTLMPLWVDSFTQPAGANGIDIIWVIDRSGSMHDEASQVLLGIEAMMNALPATDWRLLMINVDQTISVNDVTFPLVPGDTLWDATMMYNSMANSRFERGFASALAYIAENPYSQTWMRHDAALLIVFVSDENDQSNTEFPAPSSFNYWLNGYRQNAFLASIVHLSPSESLCNPSTSMTGQRYIDATDAVMGEVIDICSDDWTAGVAASAISIQPHETWDLRKIPVYPEYMKVFVDGYVMAQGSWHYEPSENRVYFHTVPDANSLVEIAYYYTPTH